MCSPMGVGACRLAGPQPRSSFAVPYSWKRSTGSGQDTRAVSRSTVRRPKRGARPRRQRPSRAPPGCRAGPAVGQANAVKFPVLLDCAGRLPVARQACDRGRVLAPPTYLPVGNRACGQKLNGHWLDRPGAARRTGDPPPVSFIRAFRNQPCQDVGVVKHHDGGAS